MLKNKDNGFKKLYVEFLLLGAIVFSTIIIIYIINFFNMPNMKINNENVSYINDGWTVLYEMSEPEVVNIPITIAENTYRLVRIERVLPENTSYDSSICIDTFSQNIIVEVDGEKIYEYWVDNDLPFGDMYGIMWHIVKLPQDSASKTVTITAQTNQEKGESTMRSVMMGTKSAIIFELIKHSLLTLCLMVVIFMFGILMLIKCFTAKNKKLYIDISVLSILASIWLFSDTSLPQFFFNNQAACYFMSYCSFMLMCVPFFLLIKEMFLPNRKRYIRAMCLIFLSIFLVNVLLYITNLAPLSVTIAIVHVAIIVSLITTIILFIIDHNKENRTDFIFFILAFAVLFIFFLIDLYHYRNVSSATGSIYFRIGIILFAVILGIRVLRNNNNAIKSDVKTSILERLAFVDTLTELSNRAIFELDRNQLNEEMFNYNNVGFAVLDIDGLKQVNDNYGHTNGDILINAAAKCISYSFSKIGKVYRIGGDEFAVIFINSDENLVNNAIIALHENIDIYNQTAQHELGISVGYALTKVVPTKKINLLALFDEADKNMYTNKIARKATKD